MLRPQREIDAVIGCRCLQFGIKMPPEAHAQRQSQGFVDPRTERGVNHELHSPGLVKETFCHNPGGRWHRSQNTLPFPNIGARLFRSDIGNSDPPAQPLDAILRNPGAAVDAFAHL